MERELCYDNAGSKTGMHKGNYDIIFATYFYSCFNSDNTRPALSKTFLGFWVFLPRQSNRYRSIHRVCQIKTAMLQNLFSKIFKTKMMHPTSLVNLKSEHKKPMRLLKVSRNERLPTNKRFTQLVLTVRCES